MKDDELKNKIEEMINNSVYTDWEWGDDGEEYSVERVNQEFLRDNLIEFIKELLIKK